MAHLRVSTSDRFVGRTPSKGRLNANGASSACPHRSHVPPCADANLLLIDETVTGEVWSSNRKHELLDRLSALLLVSKIRLAVARVFRDILPDLVLR